MLSVFVSSLKKGAGKTTVISGLAGTMQSLSYAVSYYKPIQTATPPLDENFINKIDRHIKTSTSYAFESSKSPLIEAYYAGVKKLSLEKIYNDYKSNTQMCECHIVEGSNGISTPIDEKLTEIDIVQSLGLPLILVLNEKKDTIDDVITGVNYIYSKHIKFMGIIVNQHNENSDSIEEKYFPELITQYTKAKVLGTFPYYEGEAEPQILIANTLQKLNLEEIFGIKIAKLS